MIKSLKITCYMFLLILTIIILCFSFSCDSASKTDDKEIDSTTGSSSSLSSNSSSSSSSSASYNLRDTGPAGGLIFYINPDSTSDGWKYLEAATSNTATGRIWGPYVNYATSTAIGSGLNNTNNVVSLGGTGSYGVRDCYILVLGGYSDRFLPSLDELNLMYTNLHISSFGSFSGNYWSSSAVDDATDDRAYYQNFTSGTQYITSRLGGCNIRACRRF